MSEFELKSLITALQLLKNEDYITEDQRQLLFEFYKSDKRKYFEINQEEKDPLDCIYFFHKLGFMDLFF